MLTASIWAIGMALSLAAQSPFPMSSPAIGCCPAFGGLSYAVADFNGDGREDIAAAASGSQLGVTLTIPGGGYGTGVAIATLPGLTPPASLVGGAGDFTGDGAADILWSVISWTTVTATTYVYPGNGAGQFGTPIVVPDPSTAQEHFACVNVNVPGVTSSGDPRGRHLRKALRIRAPDVHRRAHARLPVGELRPRRHAFRLGSASAPYRVLLPLRARRRRERRRAARPRRVRGDERGAEDLDHPAGHRDSPAFRRPHRHPGPSRPARDVRARGRERRRARRRDRAQRRGLDQPVYNAIDEVVCFGHPTSPLSTFTVSVTGAASNQSPVVEDLDGDGNRDLLLSIYPLPNGNPNSWPLAFSRGDGNGHFGPALYLQSPVSSMRCVAADENGDGMKDVVGLFGYPTFVLHNQSRIGPGGPGANGIVPQTTAGLATPGNPFFHIGLTGASHNSPAILGVSLGILHRALQLRAHDRSHATRASDAPARLVHDGRAGQRRVVLRPATRAGAARTDGLPPMGRLRSRRVGRAPATRSPRPEKSSSGRRGTEGIL